MTRRALVFEVLASCAAGLCVLGLVAIVLQGVELFNALDAWMVHRDHVLTFELGQARADAACWRAVAEGRQAAEACS